MWSVLVVSAWLAFSNFCASGPCPVKLLGRLEALGLGVVDAVHQTHELAGDIAVKPGRAEGVFHRQHARWKDRKVQRVHARRRGLGLQHQKDRWIGMVEADRANRIEPAQVVLVRHVVAVPGYDGARWPGRWSRSRPDRAGAGRRCSSRTGSRVRCRRAVRDPKAHSARDQHDLLRFDIEAPQLGGHVQPALLRDDQHLGVGVVENASLHRAVGALHVNAAVDVAGYRDESLHEVDRLGWQRQRVPAKLIGWRLDTVEITDQKPIADTLERLVHGGRTDPIQPRTPVGAVRRGERGARELLGIQAVKDTAAASSATAAARPARPRSQICCRSPTGSSAPRLRPRVIFHWIGSFTSKTWTSTSHCDRSRRGGHVATRFPAHQEQHQGGD